ncbi:MAG: ABC transporter permease [Gammaproteobacteria bacterium]|nr:MAG: ABC transporter permease [Gammaproteobacteria bacterium]
MKAFFQIIVNFPRYLWSGWGAVASIFLFMALWEAGYMVYDQLVLPSPQITLSRLLEMIRTEGIMQDAEITLKRAIWGFLLSALLGSVLGMSAGLFVTASIMSRPIITMLTGMPPITWIVLAMIWFGMGGQTVVFTVVVTCFPIIFVGALQGTRTLEGRLSEMADSFHTPLWMRFTDIYLPHVFSYLFPAWMAALGMSWKIVVMAELLSANDGLGAALAITRSHLDTAGTLALVVLLVGSLLIVEYLLMEPIKREVEQWRD